MGADWFTVNSIGPGVWVLQEPIGRVAPRYDVPSVNFYLIQGTERAALIDSGMGMADVAAACQALTDRPVINICTHSHWDHVGSAYQFARRLIHPLEAARLEQEYDVDQLTHIKAAPATGMLSEGQEIDLGGRSLTVLHTPGHSSGHVSLLDSTTGYLFCADTCYAGTMWIQSRDANTAHWRRSLVRIAEAGATRVCGGHGEPLQEPALVRRVIAGLDAALSDRSVTEPFPGQPEVLKHRFDTFSILLRK